ncbi:MAG: hypothetical protein AMXMBFR12_03780 [Candidatus Babeliales bacterium]
MKSIFILLATLYISSEFGMQPLLPTLKNPESLQTICLKHFLYNTKQIKDERLKRILSREKIEPFEEYQYLFDEKVNPKIAAQIQILLYHDLKPTPNFPLLSTLTTNWPVSEPLVSLQSTLTLIIEKGLTNSSEICRAIHAILTHNVPNPRFALAEFLIEKGLKNDLYEYFEQFPNSLRVWPTINYGNLTNNMRLFLHKVAQAELPLECKNSFLRLAAQRRISHQQTEYDQIITLLIEKGADISILSVHEQDQLSALFK